MGRVAMPPFPFISTDYRRTIIDSISRGKLLGVSLVACGYGLWSIGSFFLKLVGKLIRLLSDPAARHQ